MGARRHRATGKVPQVLVARAMREEARVARERAQRMRREDALRRERLRVLQQRMSTGPAAG